jgi:hypothetical protein
MDNADVANKKNLTATREAKESKDYKNHSIV